MLLINTLEGTNMFMFIESILPMCIAILSLALFTKQTKKLCYAAVSLSVLAELIPLEINTATLFACTACLASMIIIDFLGSIHLLNISTVIKHK